VTLYDAISNDDIEKLKVLLQGGQNPDELDDYGQSPLFRVIFNKTHHQKELVNLLITFGANVNFQKKDGTTPLFHAKGKITTILLENGADVNIKSFQGTKALHHAIDVETTQVLLEYGGDINDKDRSLSTPLHNYVYFGGDLVQFAIRKGADVNASNNLGWTPLICLARTEGADNMDNIDIIKTADILLKTGADINAVDNLGMKAYDHALEMDINNMQLAEYLKNWNKN